MRKLSLAAAFVLAFPWGAQAADQPDATFAAYVYFTAKHCPDVPVDTRLMAEKLHRFYVESHALKGEPVEKAVDALVASCLKLLERGDTAATCRAAHKWLGPDHWDVLLR